MVDIQKIISANPINQGSAVVNANQHGSITKVDANIAQLGITGIQSKYDDRMDDYGLRRKTIQIGDWNMDSTASVNVAHGLSGDIWKNIRSVEIVIRNDADDTYYDNNETGGDVSVTSVGDTNVIVERAAAGTFDTTTFDSTSYNRGWVTIWYE